MNTLADDHDVIGHLLLDTVLKVGIVVVVVALALIACAVIWKRGR